MKIDLLTGEWLKKVRVEKGFTPKQLSEATGIKPSQIYEYEAGRGKLGLANILKLAEFFGLEIHSVEDPAWYWEI